MPEDASVRLRLSDVAAAATDAALAVGTCRRRRLVVKAHRLVYHSTLRWRGIKKNKKTLVVSSPDWPALDVRGEGGVCGAERGARATVTTVSTEAAGSAETDAMATLEDASASACATPATYASRLDAVNSARVVASLAVKVTDAVQEEHASHAPPSAPAKPAAQ